MEEGIQNTSRLTDSLNMRSSLVSLVLAALGVVLKVLCSPQISKPRDLKRKSNFCKYAQDALAA